MKKSDYFSLKFEDDRLIFCDQTHLPFEEKYIATDDYEVIADAIRRLAIRGAPAIGIAGAYALALAVKIYSSPIHFSNAYETLLSTRPTAVNLRWALNELKQVYEGLSDTCSAYQNLLERALAIHQDDIEKCRMMGEHGLSIFKKPSVVLTHCNTGRFATGGEGTAFSVLRTANEAGLITMVYADETRPLLQGSRLTAFELSRQGIPFTVLPDSAAASLMSAGMIDLVITGSDRIAVNGDAANKVGTYMLAVLCAYHKIPFYIAAPTSTFDPHCPTGADIPIEQRSATEVLHTSGTPVAFPDAQVYNPSFDVTPASLITGVISENGLHLPPYNFRK